jgi:catechol 2,3-dioxygenase-like lactoylglutathione lyase family enzyme
MEMRLELVAVPVSDPDLAKSFYVDKVGFNADHDIPVQDGLRFIQLTPPGSACSIALGVGITEAEPGSVQGLQMVVASAAEAHGALRRGRTAAPGGDRGRRGRCRPGCAGPVVVARAP